MPRKLSFYDHHRQSYHDAVWKPDHDAHVGEFCVGDYARDGGVGPRGELSLHLFDFSHNHFDGPLSVQIRCFDDAHGTLRALDRSGVLKAVCATDLRTRGDLTALLLARGLRDMSDAPS